MSFLLKPYFTAFLWYRAKKSIMTSFTIILRSTCDICHLDILRNYLKTPESNEDNLLRQHGQC